jgi:6-pyruvoyltetrahydropterin/6-carboxytetrahydropterin synthase
LSLCYITRKEHFNAAHRLAVEGWTDEQNAALFGKCANKNWHGHNFNLFVTVKGSPDAETGIIVNLLELSRTIRRVITDEVDHKNLNLDVSFLKGIMPSIENLAIAFWNQLEPHIKGCKLHCIRLEETENNYAEYFGE